MAEDTLSSDERNAILGQVFNKSKINEVQDKLTFSGWLLKVKKMSSESLEEVFNNVHLYSKLQTEYENHYYSTPKTQLIEEKAVDYSKMSFGELLESSLSKRVEIEKKDKEINSEVRENIIKKVKPNFDVIKNWRF